MRRTTFLLSAATLLMCATRTFAQPANFAGHWVQEFLAGNADRGGFPGAPGGGRGGARGNPQGAGTFGNDFVFLQDAKTLTIKRVDTQTGDTLRATYNLDGSASTNSAIFGGGGGTPPVQTVSKVKWDGKKLVIDTENAPGAAGGGGGGGGGNGNGPSTTIIWMAGKQLRVETNRPGFNGGDPTSILAIFNKKK